MDISQSEGRLSSCSYSSLTSSVPEVRNERLERCPPRVSVGCSPIRPSQGTMTLYEVVGPGGGPFTLQDHVYVPVHRLYLPCPGLGDPGFGHKRRNHLTSFSAGFCYQPDLVLPCSLSGDDDPSWCRHRHIDWDRQVHS